jgi:hypothetical protein
VTAYRNGDHMTTAQGRVYCEIERTVAYYFDQLGTGASDRLPNGHSSSVDLYAGTAGAVMVHVSGHEPVPAESAGPREQLPHPHQERRSRCRRSSPPI